MPTSAAAAALPHLNAEYLEQHPVLSHGPAELQLPERVLQFGEGGFLRGFVDWMIHGMNRKGLFNGRVVVVQPIAHGQVKMLNAQRGAYTLLMRGIENGTVTERKELITSISRGIDPYTQFAEYLKCAHNPDLRFIVSNTTEAGISYSADDKQTDQPPASFPAKLTLLLLERYKAFNGDASKGFILLPCELIDRNGDNLKKTVLKTAQNWKLDTAFIQWIESANVFTNTLVDRIVTGYPKDSIETLWAESGYRDDLFDSSELFHLWVIEGPASLAEELPLAKAGFNVIVSDNMKPYRDRKVGILNGAHTSTVPAAYLAGFNFVGDFMADPAVSGFMRQAIADEVIPTLTLPKAELDLFATSVFERFSNPFIHHALLSITLNSVSKYKARVLPSLERYLAQQGKLPKRLAFALAALIVFYRGTDIKDGALIGHRDGREYPIKDSLPILEKFASLWSAFATSDGSLTVRTLTDAVLEQKDWWGKDLRELPGLSEAVAADVSAILAKGVPSAIANL
jgi:tagaturonate reductase